MKKIIFSFIFILLNTVCMSQKSGEQIQTHSDENKEEKAEGQYVFSNNIAKNIVTNKNGTAIGTVTYLYNGYAVSTQHGTGEVNDSLTLLFPKDTLTGKIIYSNYKNDYSIIRLNRIPKNSIELEPFIENNFNKTTLAIGYPTIKTKNGYESNRSYSQSKVVFETNNELYLNTYHASGYSGAGVFIENKIIGIITDNIEDASQMRQVFNISTNIQIRSMITKASIFFEKIRQIQNNHSVYYVYTN